MFKFQAENRKKTNTMAIEKRIYSDLPIPPGDYLAEVIAVKGISQAELARRLGRPVQAVNEIIKGEKAITPATALQLERALDVPAHIWTGLESRYQLIKARLEEKKQIRKESGYLKEIPYKQLAGLKYVGKARDDEHKVRELHRFYGVSSLANLRGIKAYEASFRHGEAREASSYALAAWMRSAELQARETPAGGFDRRKLKKALKDIQALSAKDPAESVPELKGLLAGCGVVLVLLPIFPKTGAMGATFWIKPDKAVLMLSAHGRSPDDFRYRLFHQIGHLLLHGKGTFIDARKVSPEPARKEQEADDFARDWLAGAVL
jgi:HTH-type transcriptional regulator/antitoxin HigA